ncbi:netrin receptor DCC-like isoform X1 [Homalodisca vitripennis]|uniref:netrin receptor DCC-like isoform X1 n=1 Tax=Homalodisca vitripennis TaxID=197043 RepID=UPI001EEB34BC|nr:netrin receptor DCC-like isoform X1 [Homalodisca vitripennis]XP_046681831.1 netrin receptor DCC-like isoform X1 [Homalodisca vitripennis]
MDGGGLSNMTLLLILLACCVLLIAGVAIGIAIVCCRKASVSQDRSKKGYTKGNTGKPGASNIKPPDLWIHHDQMDLKNMEKVLTRVSGRTFFCKRSGH